MKILLTGASGFLGKFIYSKLFQKHDLLTIGRSSSNDIIHDLTAGPVSLGEKDIDIVIHAAGMAHIYPETEAERRTFYDVNTKGTDNLLRSIRRVKQFTFISTVAVYGLDEGTDIDENCPLNGNSPYSDSKIKAEKLILNWGKENDVHTLILRLPLIAGKNPPGNLGKMIKAIKKNRYLSIDKGKAKKSGVRAEDVAEIISKSFGKSGIYNLTDQHHPSFREYEELICNQLDKSMPMNMPLSVARIAGFIGDIVPLFPVNSNTVIKMSRDLTFNDDKAVRKLNWQPKKIIEHFKIN